MIGAAVDAPSLQTIGSDSPVLIPIFAPSS
jgi:hypothetical protein